MCHKDFLHAAVAAKDLKCGNYVSITVKTYFLNRFIVSYAKTDFIVYNKNVFEYNCIIRAHLIITNQKLKLQIFQNLHIFSVFSAPHLSLLANENNGSEEKTHPEVVQAWDEVKV